MSGTSILDQPLTPEFRSATLPDVDRNEWHSAVSLRPAVWSPQMAAHSVNDPEHPNEAFRVVVDEDHHHDSILSQIFYDEHGNVTRTLVDATPRFLEQGIEDDPARVALLGDSVIQLLKTAQENR